MNPAKRKKLARLAEKNVVETVVEEVKPVEPVVVEEVKAEVAVETVEVVTETVEPTQTVSSKRSKKVVEPVTE